MKQIRILLLLFTSLLVLSGITAFPVKTELAILTKYISAFPYKLQDWINILNESVRNTPDIIFYGTDWLAFSHIIISLFFIPVFINPIKYKMNVIIGIISCLAVFPLAFICGAIRGIPFFHQLIDCSFGAGGMILLYIIYKKINQLEKNENY